MKPEQAKQAFQSVANAVGGELLQALAECGEELVIDRDALIDYLEIHGGEHGKIVMQWVRDLPGDMSNVHRALDKMGVPRRWS